MNHSTMVLSFLTFCCVVVIAGYVFTETYLLEQRYSISDLQREIVGAQEESKELQVQINEGNLILDEDPSFLYTEIEQPNYIERPSVSPFNL